MKQAAHSLLGASGAYRWLNCPGSFRLSVTARPRSSSRAAATGTLAHTFIEKLLRSNRDRMPRAELGLRHTVEGHEIIVDQDFIDGVNRMLDYTYAAQRKSDWIIIEAQVELDSYFDLPPPVLLFGRVDVGMLDLRGGTLEVIDYKNGAGLRVVPRDNPQLLYYAAGLLKQVPANQQHNIIRIKLTVVQPNVPGAEAVRSWEITVVDLLMWIDEVLVPGVEACAADDAPLVPGPWCRWCPALQGCPRLLEDAITMAQHDFDTVKLPDDPDELAKQLDIADNAILWAQAVQKHALEQLQRQVRIPGWELVPTRPTRKWNEDDPVVAATLAGMGVGDTVIYETSVRSPPQVEKLLSKSHAGRDVWNDQIADLLVHSVSSGVKLARKQRAEAAEDFSNVDGE